MVAAGGGTIINVSSTGSLRPDGHIVPYAAAKAGLNAMTEGLAKAFGPTVRVNTLMAGPFLTDVSKAWNLEQETGNRFAGLALQRAGNPSEIVGARFVSDVRRVELHHRVDPAGRRRYSVGLLSVADSGRAR